MRQSRVHPFFCAVLLIFTTVPYGVNARDCHTSWRRAWRDLTCEQQDGYLDAVLQLKVSGIYDDEFRYTHKYFGKLTHATAEFLPWHRWFLYQFEKALQQVTGKYIYVPYWDWERDAGNEQLSTVFHAETFGTYGNVEEGTNCTVDGQFNSTPGSVFEHASYFRDYVKKDCLQRVFNDDVQFSGESQILAMIASLEQYEDATDPDDDRAANGFRTILEGTPHAFPHIMLGGHMTTNFSPDDPLFYVHHANVDRIWSLWQDYWDHDLVGYDDFEVPWHYEGDLLDEPLPFGLEEISWDFQMEWEEQNDSGEWIVKKGYPSPRDLLSNRQPHISVRYVNDYLSTIMPGYEPNPRWFQAAEGEVEVQCDRDKSEESFYEKRGPATMELFMPNYAKKHVRGRPLGSHGRTRLGRTMEIERLDDKPDQRISSHSKLDAFNGQEASTSGLRLLSSPRYMFRLRS